MNNYSRGSLTDFFFNVASKKEDTFFNYITYSFTIFLIFIAIMTPFNFEFAHDWFPANLIFVISVLQLVCCGAIMHTAKSKIGISQDEVINSHLEMVKLVSSVYFYFTVGTWVFSFLIEKYEVITVIFWWIVLAVDVIAGFASYTALSRLRQGLPYGFDDD